MLVLSVKEHESVIVNGEILVSVVRIRGRQTKLALQGKVRFVRCELPARPGSKPSSDGCLVVTRLPQQGVSAGTLGTVTILRIRGNRVSIGFDFPESVAVHRKDVYERKFGPFDTYQEPWERSA